MSRPRRASLRSAAPGPPLPGAGLSSRQLRGLTPVMGWGGQAQGHPPPPRLPGRQASAEEERDPSPGGAGTPLPGRSAGVLQGEPPASCPTRPGPPRSPQRRNRAKPRLRNESLGTASAYICCSLRSLVESRLIFH